MSNHQYPPEQGSVNLTMKMQMLTHVPNTHPHLKLPAPQNGAW